MSGSPPHWSRCLFRATEEWVGRLGRPADRGWQVVGNGASSAGCAFDHGAARRCVISRPGWFTHSSVASERPGDGWAALGGSGPSMASRGQWCILGRLCL